MATRAEITGVRSLEISQWSRDELPCSKCTGHMVSDIDFYMFNERTKRHCLVEVKQNNGPMKSWQERMYNRLSRWIKNGGEDDGWEFVGSFVLRFENKNFYDGSAWLNGESVSEDDVRDRLSMFEPWEDSSCKCPANVNRPKSIVKDLLKRTKYEYVNMIRKFFNEEDREYIAKKIVK